MSTSIVARGSGHVVEADPAWSTGSGRGVVGPGDIAEPGDPAAPGDTARPLFNWHPVHMHRWVSLFAPIALAILLLAPDATVGQDAGSPLVDVSVDGSPLLVGSGGDIEVMVTLAAAADLRLRIADFDGRTIQELYTGSREAGTLMRSWRGRDDDGVAVQPGPYRVVATASGDGRSERATEWLSVVERKVYPSRPGYITVAVDPGHGGRLSGAVGADGTREADLNLDIGLRLARMLEGAGVNVVITRTRDAFVNTPEEDRSGDGVIDETDELAARPDAANEARADLFISVHNNTAVNTSVGGPSTFFYDERPFSARSARLATIIQDEMVAALDAIGGSDHEPYDHGALIYPYYVLRGFDPPRLRRPTQMPAVLSEGMFLSNPRELRLLKRPAVRAAMAAAYYDAIAKYLARREDHVGYELIFGPTGPVPAGSPATYQVEVRNAGNEEMRGWDIVVDVQPRLARYVGRLRAGESVGRARIPRLRPGTAAVVDVDVTAPVAGGEWMLLIDARDRDDQRASRLGSPMLQVPLTTLDPPAPTPTALPTSMPEDGGD
jgi:N-acetylmuramoyl-L-alanine amidase